MKCHYVVDPELGRVLIPCCYQTEIHDDIRFCTCPKGYRSFEKLEYNTVIKEMASEIEYWKKEVERLNKIILNHEHHDNKPE